jgi:hypothetical protein
VEARGLKIAMGKRKKANISFAGKEVERDA